MSSKSSIQNLNQKKVVPKWNQTKSDEIEKKNWTKKKIKKSPKKLPQTTCPQGPQGPRGNSRALSPHFR